MIRAALALAAVAVLAGCNKVTEFGVREALEQAGVPEDTASCMASRMAERLTLDQLRELERLGPEEGEAPVPVTIAEYLERVRRIEDPEVLEVTASSAAICAFSRSPSQQGGG